MSSNLKKRIISALLLTLLVAVALSINVYTAKALILLAGILLVDELTCNFYKKRRFSGIYIYGQIAFLLLTFFTQIISTDQIQYVFVMFSLFFGIMQLAYLFLLKKGSSYEAIISNYLVTLIGGVVFLLVYPLFYIMDLQMMIKIIVVLMVVNFGMDIGAWFFGKNFGKNKLWPEVSPNKTVEGLIGGSLTSAFLGTLFVFLLFGKFSFSSPFLFLVLGVMSQLGDLVQSKLKRQCGIKDSSALIPGHGGVYDRIDSLVFLSPFFVISLKYISL